MKFRSSLGSCLPDDLMVVIIEKLPVKDLLRFMSVNKSCYCLITSSSFIKSTISNTNSNDRYLLCTHDDDDNDTLKDSSEGDEDEDELIYGNRLKYYYTLKDLSKGDEDKLCDNNINGLDCYYTPELFGSLMVKVYGICKGLVCVSECNMGYRSSIFLWNPVIRKAKKISNGGDVNELFGDADLCFGYFRDDYKVVRIARFRGGKYRVGVYSLSTDAWNVMYWGSDSAAHSLICNPSSTKFFDGVAYFGVANYVNNKCKLIGVDLNQEKIRDVEFPDEFYSHLALFSVEPWKESIALLEIRRDNLTMWVLRNCATRKTSTWEKEFTFELETSIHTYPLGFTKHGRYLLRDDKGLGSKYFWDFGTSQLEEITFDMGTKDLLAIDSLVGNLVLLNEKTLDPIVETEPCSTQNTFVLYTTMDQIPCRYIIKRTGMEKVLKKERKEMLNKTQNGLLGRGTKRRKEETGMEKPWKKKRKEILDTMQNRLQGRGTKRRKEETEMEKPRKKERKEISDTMQIRLQGRGAKRRMEETEMEKPRKK